MDDVRPACDGHLEREWEDGSGGPGFPDKEERDGSDPDLEEWLAARAADVEERRFARFDLEAEW